MTGTLAPNENGGALAGVRVLDCSGDLGAYGPRLLASLGATVARVSDARNIANPSRLAYEIYLQTSKLLIKLNPDLHEDCAKLSELAGTADIVFDRAPGSLLAASGIDEKVLRAKNPALVITRIAPLGVNGPDAGRSASDLTLCARGGLMWLAGEPGFPPVRPAGSQSAIATGLYGLIGTLLALRHAEATGVGQIVEVSALEVIATALENSVQYWDLERTIRSRAGSKPREAGTGLFPCVDGFVYLMAGRLSTPRGWVSIVEWLIEAGIEGAKIMQAPEWNAYAFRTRPDSTAIFVDVFKRFAATRRKAELYEEGQRRGIVMCPLNTPLDLLSDRQLMHRKFFAPMTLDESGVIIQVPRGPFTLSATPLVQPTAGKATSKYFSWPSRVSEKAFKPTVSGHEMPLSGIRVADFTWVGAGPFATKVLADHGAEVIKIESSTRIDVLRTTPPFRDGISGVNRSGYFANRNTSKKSLTLNLSDPRGIALARALIAKSDVVANSFTPGTMEKWGLGYEDCRKLRSDIIFLSMPMHASNGPHSQFVGYGAAIGALSGLYATTGYADRDPTGTGTNYPDHVPNPCHAAIAVLAALRHRRLTGEGQAIELSQVESTICALAPLLISAQLDAKSAATSIRLGNRETGVAPHGVYPARGEDRWIAIACWSEKEWQALSASVAAGWEQDPRFATLALRIQNHDALDQLIARWTCEHELSELSEILLSRGIDAAPVQNARDVIEQDRQLAHVGHWVKLEHPEMGCSIYDAPPFHMSLTPGALRAPAPMLGQHNDEICASVLGLQTDEIANLRTQGVIK